MAINYHTRTSLEFFDYLIDKATPEEILAYKASEQEQERAYELLDKNNAGTLTPEEAVELAEMQEVNRLVALVKARALRKLNEYRDHLTG
jgi:hypothetical protein